METEKTKNKKKFYYGWFIFGACFLMVMVSLGFGSSQKSTYLKAVTEQLGLSRGGFEVNNALRYITTALLNFFFGFLVKRLHARRMIALGFLSLVAAFVINGFATEYWHFYAGGILLGAGLAWTTTTIVGYVAETWFTSHKGTMMGILLAANGLGGFLSEPIVTKLIYGADGSLSDADARWRLAYFVTAGLFAVVGLIVTLVVRDRPEDVGLKPLGGDKPAKKKRGASWEGYEMKEVLRKPFFYISAAAVFVIGFTLQSMSGVAKPHMYDIGITKDFVIRAFMLHSLMLMIAKMSFGFLFDRVGIRLTTGLCTLSALAAIASLAFISVERSGLAYGYSILSSFGLPMETVMIPLLVSELFGKKSFSHVMGYYLALNYLGFAAGTIVTNTVFDLMGTYRVMLYVMVGAMLAAGLASQISMFLASRERKRFEARKAAEPAALNE